MLQSVVSSPAAHAHATDQRLFFLLLAGYFLLHTLIRSALPGGLGLDEAEQVYNYQALRLGYGIQPPLYSWLQSLFFGVFGVNAFALALLKNLLLFATYLLVYQVGRQLAGSGVAVTAAAALLLVPQIGWESQRDLTHSVLLTACVAGILWTWLRLLEHPTTGRYALLGLLFAAAFQAKYSFAPLAAALLATSLLDPASRRLWRRGAWAAIAAGLLASLPHGLWMLDRLPQLLAGTAVEIVGPMHRPAAAAGMPEGLWGIVAASVSFAALPLLVFAASGRRALWRRPDLGAPGARFFLYFFAACYIALALTVVVGGITGFKSRWLQPFLFVLPLAILLAWPGLQAPVVMRRIRRTALAVGLAILVAIPARALLGPEFGRSLRSQQPYAELAAHLATHYPGALTVYTTRRGLAGNLLLLRSELRAQVIDEPFPLFPRPEKGDLLVAPERDAAQWRRWLAEQGLTTAAVQTLRPPLPQHPEISTTYQIAVIDIPGKNSRP